MKNPFRRTPLDTPEGAQQAVKQAHARVDSAKATLSEAKAAHGRAVLASDEGEDNAAAEVSRSRTRLDKAEQALADAEAALSAAEARFQEVQSKLQDGDTADRWKRVEQLAKERTRLAGELEKTMAEFVRLYHQLLQVGQDMHLIAPSRDDKLNMSLAGPNRTEAGVRNHLAALDLPWAATTRAIPAIDFPTLGSVVADGNAAILSRRPTSTVKE